jgi:hypothetical protein
MSLVFQNILTPHPLLPLAGVSPPPPTKAGVHTRGGRTHSAGGEGGGGSIFWKTRDIGLASYSNTVISLRNKYLIND